MRPKTSDLDLALDRYRLRLEQVKLNIKRSWSQAVSVSPRPSTTAPTFVPSVPLPSELYWIPQSSLATWRSSLPMRVTCGSNWVLEYRQPVHPKLCSHSIHSASDGYPHFILRGDKTIRFTGDGSIQSAQCWANHLLPDPTIAGALSMSDYIDFGESTGEQLASMLEILGGSAYGSLQIEGSQSIPDRCLCGSSHSAEEFTSLREEQFYWVTNSPSEMHMCMGCMYGYTELPDGIVYIAQEK